MRHTCSTCAHASFNTYWNWKVLVLKGCDHLIHNKEVFTQGDPLDMILYGLGVLPIIQALKYHMEDTEKKVGGTHFKCGTTMTPLWIHPYPGSNPGSHILFGSDHP